MKTAMIILMDIFIAAIYLIILRLVIDNTAGISWILFVGFFGTLLMLALHFYGCGIIKPPKQKPRHATLRS